jgi:hypothetical protein
MRRIRHNGHDFVIQQAYLRIGDTIQMKCLKCKTIAQAVSFQMRNGGTGWMNWSANEHCGIHIARQIMES